MADYQLKFKATLDTTQLNQQLKAVQSQISTSGGSGGGSGGGSFASANVELAAFNVNLGSAARALTLLGDGIGETITLLTGNSGLSHSISDLVSSVSHSVSSGMQVYKGLQSISPQLAKAAAVIATGVTAFNAGVEIGSNIFGTIENLESVIDAAYKALEQKDEFDLKTAKEIEAAAKGKYLKALNEAADALKGGRMSVEEFQEAIGEAESSYNQAKAAREKAEAKENQRKQKEEQEAAAAAQLRDWGQQRKRVQEIESRSDTGGLERLRENLESAIQEKIDIIASGKGSEKTRSSLSKSEELLAAVNRRLSDLYKESEKVTEAERQKAEETARQIEETKRAQDWLDTQDFYETIGQLTDEGELASRKEYWDEVAEAAADAIRSGNLTDEEGKSYRDIFSEARSFSSAIGSRLGSIQSERENKQAELQSELAAKIEAIQSNKGPISSLASIGGSIAGEDPIADLDRTMTEVKRIEERIEQIIRKFAPALGVSA